MAEHELELAAKFGLPEWGGFAAKIEAKYRAAWRMRGTSFVEAVAEGAGLDAETLGERLLDNETAADLFRLGLNRAAEVSDGDYITALGRAVAGALDDATVDTDSYIVREITKLEPSQLRVFLSCFRYQHHKQGDGVLEDSLFDIVFSDDVRPDQANVAEASTFSVAELSDRGPIHGDLVVAALEQLSAAGFVRKNSLGDVEFWEYQVSPAGLGMRALSLMFPSIEIVASKPTL